MKKKLLFAALFSSVAFGAMAQSKFEGAYGQVAVGFTSVSPSVSNASLTPPAGNSPSSYSYSTSTSSSNSFAGAVGLGYTFSVTPTYTVGIGGDYLPINGQSANVSFTNSQLSPATSTYSWKQKQSYDFYIAPGIAVSPESLVYAKLGYSNTQIGLPGTNVNLSGYLVGLGYKQIISGGFYGFAEANYTSYGNKTVTGSGPWTGSPSGTYNTSQTFSANAITGLVGVGYKF